MCFVPRHLILLLITYYYSQVFSPYLASCHFFRLKLASLAKHPAKQPRTTDLSVFSSKKSNPTHFRDGSRDKPRSHCEDCGVCWERRKKFRFQCALVNPSQEQLVTSLVRIPLSLLVFNIIMLTHSFTDTARTLPGFFLRYATVARVHCEDRPSRV